MNQDGGVGRDKEEYQPFLPGFGRWTDATAFEIWAASDGEVDLEERRAVYEELYGVQAGTPTADSAQAPAKHVRDQDSSNEIGSQSIKDRTAAVMTDSGKSRLPARGCAYD